MTVPLAAAGTATFSQADLTPESWLPEARRLQQEDWWFEALWAPRRAPPGIRAVWSRRGEFRILDLECADLRFPSLTPILPASDWFERSARDRTGLQPVGHVDPRPFHYHETYPEGHTAPRPLSNDPLVRKWDYPFVRHEGPGVFEIPVGPIHAGILEPGHFRFTTVGEIILDLEIRLNYTHKGTLDLVRGKPLEHAVRILERLSGDNAAAHASAFAAACEAALQQPASEGVERLRTVLVELERVYNHLGDLAGIAVDVAFAAGASLFQALREEFLRWNGRLVGHRLLMNAVTLGGLHRGPSAPDWASFCADLPRLERRFEQAVAVLVNHSGVKERIEGTGLLSRSTARLLSCAGPTVRASGWRRDARTDAPCLSYPTLDWKPAGRDPGDVASRMWVKIEELRASLKFLEAVGGLPPHLASPPPSLRGIGEGLAVVEASRGAILSWVRVRDGHVEDAYQRDPSFLNWRGLQQAVFRNIVPDFPLINKSFNLSYSGSDA